MTRTPRRARTKGPSKSSAVSSSKIASATTPHPEAGIARGILIGSRIAKQFDVPTPTPRSRPKQDQTKSATKKRRGRPPKNPPPPLPPARPGTPPPTIKEIYYGTVTGYNHLDADYDHHDDDVGLYRVRYDDGDTEVLDPDDIYNAFLLHNDEMLRMDIERFRAFPVLASKIAPSWREGTPTGQIGGRGLAHQRSLAEEELVALDAERIGCWESYKTYNVSKGVARPAPYSPAGNRKSRASRTGASTSTSSRANQEQQEVTAATGGQTAGEISGSSEVVQPSTTMPRMTTTRRAERVSARTAAAASLAESNRTVAKPSTPRRNKRKGPSEAAAAAPTSSATTNRRSGKRRKKAAGTTGDSTQREERQAGDGDNTSETTVTVKEEAPPRNERRGWGLFRRTHINGFGDICDLT